MPRSKTVTAKFGKSAKSAKRSRRRTKGDNGAQLQLSITSEAISETFFKLELFLALPERIRQFTEHVLSHLPTYVFDLRTVPSFEGPHTSRRSVLESMNRAGVRYLDVMAMVENDGSLAAHVIEFCARITSTDSPNRPVLFLFDSMRDLLWSSSILPSAFVHHTSKRWRANFIGVDVDLNSYEHALRHSSLDVPPVHRWMVGEVLHVTAPTAVVTNSGSSSHQVPIVQLARGSSVRVLSTYSDFSAEVLVLTGPSRGETVRLPLISKFARVVP